MLARRFFVSGVVQGVGFRYFVIREVGRIGDITGFVRNVWDGRVEVYAEAEPEQMQQLEASLRRGPRSGRVSEVQVIEEPLTNDYPDFQITF
jgi:acylphosphatase